LFDSEHGGQECAWKPALGLYCAFPGIHGGFPGSPFFAFFFVTRRKLGLTQRHIDVRAKVSIIWVFLFEFTFRFHIRVGICEDRNQFLDYFLDLGSPEFPANPYNKSRYLVHAFTFRASLISNYITTKGGRQDLNSGKTVGRLIRRDRLSNF
jgi:hypothetical protein